MMDEITQIKCRHRNCVRQGAIIRTLPGGEKVLLVKSNRHDGQTHPQELRLAEIIKQEYSLTEVIKLYEEKG